MRRRRFRNPEDYAPSTPLDPETLRATVRLIAQAAQESGADVALGGGFAMQHYGSPRLTGDVDVVSDRAISSLPAGEQLSFGGERIELGGVETDIIVRDDKYRDLYMESLQYTRRFPEIALPVLSPEYLAAMKLASRQEKDELDLAYLIGAEQLDLDRTREIIDKHLGTFAVDEFEDVIIDVQLAQQREDMKAKMNPGRKAHKPKASQLKRRLMR